MNNTFALQALLYAHGGEMKKDSLCTALKISREELEQCSASLADALSSQGLELYNAPSTLSLRTSPAYAELIETLFEKNKETDIGSAGLEVLAIVLYASGATRYAIDTMRGVNSSGTLRQLVMRGLLERIHTQEGSRTWNYQATPELYAYLGIAENTQLPEYTALHTQLTLTS